MKHTLRSEVMLRELDDEVLLYDSRSGEAFLLNEVGAAIVDFLLAGVAEAPEITAEITEVTGADAERVRADVDAFLATLLERDLAQTEP